VTSESRMVIDVTDISGIELECAECGAKILYPVNKYREQLATRCPNCRDLWFMGNENIPGNPAQGMEKITTLITALRDATGRPDIRARVHLLIASRAPDASRRDSGD